MHLYIIARCTGDTRVNKTVLVTLQARERLLLQLRDHLQCSLPCATLTPAWQQCLQQIQQGTCIGPRTALQPAVAEVLGTLPPSTYIVSLYVAQDGSMLYCTAMMGQQPEPPVKGKPGKQGKPAGSPL